MDNITVKQGDYGYALNFTVNDADGAAFSLTGYTVILKVWSPVTPQVPILEADCDNLVEASGTCEYMVADGDFDTPGTYQYELELTSDTSVESTDTGTLTVKSSPVTVATP